MKMAKNFLVKVKQEAYTEGLIEGWNKGFDTGLQFMTDIFETALNDSAVVGKDTFGKGRMMKVRAATTEMAEKLKPSMYGVTDPEADVVQAHIDARLKKLWGEDYDEYPVRYPNLEPCSYKGRKEK